MPIINVVHDFRYGKIMYPARDRYIGRALAVYGEYSEGEAQLYRQLIKEGDTVVEAGANIGSLTIPLARFVGEQGRVIAFEPQRLIFQILCGNIALNNLTNVYCYNKGVSDKASSILIDDPKAFEPDANTGNFVINSRPEGYQIDLVRLDDLNLKACRLLKIDVEGMELQVLKGAAAMIKKLRPFIYTEANNSEKNKELLQYLKAMNYKIYEHRPPFFNPNNFYGNQENIFIQEVFSLEGKPVCKGNIISYDWLCIPAEMQVDMKGFNEVE